MVQAEMLAEEERKLALRQFADMDLHYLADMTEAQRDMEFDRIMIDLGLRVRSPDGQCRPVVQVSPPRPPPVKVRAKGRRRK